MMIRNDGTAGWIAVGLIVSTLLTAGCTGTRTTWDVRGTYQARYTREDGTVEQVSFSAHPTGGGITSDSRVGLCDVHSVTWDVPQNPELNKLSGIATDLLRSLCVTGVNSVSGGHVIVWGNPVGNSTTLTGIRSDLWQVSGTLTVTGYTNFNPPEPAVNKEVLSETASGTFSALARSPDGKTVRLDNGTFTFEIVIRTQ
ncbi:MAG: hypothetical protein ABI565_06125, partial [Vicinamibacteria bacterium]